MDDASGEARALHPRIRWRWMLRGLGPVVALAAIVTAAVWATPVSLSPPVGALAVLVGGVGCGRWRSACDMPGGGIGSRPMGSR
jgi:hypothetical protein